MWRDPIPDQKAEQAEAGMILGIETSCDETAAALVTDAARSARTSSPRRPSCTRATAASCPRSRRGGTSSSSRPSCARRSARPGRRSTTSTRSRSRRARARRRAARRRLGGEGARLGARPAARRPSTTCTATSPRSTSRPIRSSRRSSACSRAAATRCCSTCTTTPATACSARRSTTRPARRSTRAPACSGSATPAARAIDRLAREGDPDAFSFPVARLDGLDFSFSGVKTALLYAVRDLGDAAEAREADLAASYQRAIVRALVERTRAAAEQTGHDADRRRRRRRGELGAARVAAGRPLRAARALHRQRRDDRVGGPVRQAPSLSSLP